jgi:uncharacterized protein (DUF433 family)
MMLNLEARPAPIQVDEHGVARVGGTRVTLDSVVYAFRDGASAEAIADRFDSLDLADIYAVIAFYLQEGEAVDAYLHDREREARALREQIERRFPSDGLRKALLARRAAKDAAGS